MDKTDKIVKKIDYYKLRSYNKQLKSEIFDIENELHFSETGDVQLDCQIGTVDRVFSPYDIAKDTTINDDFSEYLMQETEIIPIRHELEIRLHVEHTFTEENEKQICKALKRYYSFQITSNNLRIKKNLRRAFLMYFLGAISLGLNMLSSFMGASTIISLLPIYEITSFAVWFFLWEATGLSILEVNHLKRVRYNMLRLYNAKVTVLKDSNTVIPAVIVIKDKTSSAQLSQAASQAIDNKSTVKQVNQLVLAAKAEQSAQAVTTQSLQTPQ